MELEGLHLLILSVTAILIVYSDHLALSYVRGKKLLLDRKLISRLHWGVGTGLSLMIATGVLMFLPERDEFLSNPAFIIKMCMVLALLANALLIGKLSPIASTTPFKDLPSRTKTLLFVSGAVSIVGWITAAIIGLFFL